MRNISGPPVEGEDFFGRERDVALFWESLQTQDVLLLGPRRIGKTSIARKVMSVAAAEGWNVIELNVASCKDEREFVEKLANELDKVTASGARKVYESFRARMSSVFSRIKSVQLPAGEGNLAVELAPQVPEDWACHALETLTLISGLEHPWLVYVDELPIFLFNMIAQDAVSGPARARRFLDWFRNDVRALPACKERLHWLVSGSIGLDTFVQRHHMADTINTFRQMTLEPLDAPSAVRLLRRLATSYHLQLADEHYQQLIEAVGWLQPYYLQLAFHELRSVLAAGAHPPDPAIACIAERLVRPGCDNDFHHWEQRLPLQLGEEDGAAAIGLLTAACVRAQGSTGSKLFAELERLFPSASEAEHKQRYARIRDVLLRDGYLCVDSAGSQKRYRFLLEPLRRWWLRRHSL